MHCATPPRRPATAPALAWLAPAVEHIHTASSAVAARPHAPKAQEVWAAAWRSSSCSSRFTSEPRSASPAGVLNSCGQRRSTARTRSWCWSRRARGHQCAEANKQSGWPTVHATRQLGLLETAPLMGGQGCSPGCAPAPKLVPQQSSNVPRPASPRPRPPLPHAYTDAHAQKLQTARPRSQAHSSSTSHLILDRHVRPPLHQQLHDLQVPAARRVVLRSLGRGAGSGGRRG